MNGVDQEWTTYVVVRVERKGKGEGTAFSYGMYDTEQHKGIRNGTTIAISHIKDDSYHVYKVATTGLSVSHTFGWRRPETRTTWRAFGWTAFSWCGSHPQSQNDSIKAVIARPVEQRPSKRPTVELRGSRHVATSSAPPRVFACFGRGRRRGFCPARRGARQFAQNRRPNDAAGDQAVGGGPLGGVPFVDYRSFAIITPGRWPDSNGTSNGRSWN